MGDYQKTSRKNEKDKEFGCRRRSDAECKMEGHQGFQEFRVRLLEVVFIYMEECSLHCVLSGTVMVATQR